MSAAGEAVFRRLRELDGVWLALDTETTGIGPYDQVIELAIVGSDLTVRFQSLVSTAKPIPQTATRIHGIEASDLRDAPSWPEVWNHAQNLIRERTVFAWNAPFDLRLIRQTCTRHRQPMMVREFLCLRQAFHWRFPRVESSLAAAALALGIPDRPTHRAADDARVAAWVGRRLVRQDT